MIMPITYTVPHVLLAPENPDGEIDFPSNVSVVSEGFVLIVLDGVGRDYLLDENLMPEINSYRQRSATAHITTGPLTLSATCVSEMMTGVPNAPINGLRNFDLNHPGYNDPWLLAANDPRYRVGIVGSYVMGNLYASFDEIEFRNTFKGHSDYYAGDLETSDIAKEWLEDYRFNVMAIHFSGPDKVGHTWGADSEEYKRKLSLIDKEVSTLLDNIPRNWSVVLTADHGMTDMGTHGSSEDITREVAAIVSGPNIVAGALTKNHQRDISALLPLILGLPFPNQLHGRIPLDLFDYTEDEKELIEQWNWEAAYNRQLFFHGDESDFNLNPNKTDWDSISEDSEFSRPIDISISILTWLLISFCVILVLGISRREIARDWKIFTVFLCCIVISLTSQAMLKYSAMIPRAIGGLCSVWLVGYTLSNASRITSDKKSRLVIDDLLHKPILWCSISVLIAVISWSILVSVVSTLLLYSVLYSVSAAINSRPIFNNGKHNYVPLVIALMCATYGSIRLWYTLLPLFFILLGKIFQSEFKSKSQSDRLAVISMTMLTFFAVFFVHRRIFGEHYILEAVEKAWPRDFQSMIMPSVLLVFGAILTLRVLNEAIQKGKIVALAFWLNYGLVVSVSENSYIDIVTLILVAVMYALSLYYYLVSPDMQKSAYYGIAGISMQMLLTWGPWSAFASMLTISCSNRIWKILSYGDNENQYQNNRTILAMAVIPWVLWILWWTLLGQVNGLQTCFEGICPHPRELDPGTIIVRGGYVGARENPNLYWMILMIASPIVITSVMIMKNLQNSGVNLYPYIILQSLIILGCLSVISFSPEYPRLVFSLTWNVTFAMLQLTIAIVVHCLRRKSTAMDVKLSWKQSTVDV